MSFASFNLDPRLQRGISDLGFTQPTPIQNDGIPPALAGRDLLACAMTGSGKTAAFLVPILQRLLMQPSRGTTRALILAPTRELASQIVDHFNDLARHTPLKAAAVYGGVGMEPQTRAFKRGVDVLVACPGRLLDHFQYPYASLKGLQILVLDEADRMLDMGFLPDIRRVLNHLPPVAQTLLFSATLPRPIVTLSRQLLQNPANIDIERPSSPATGVRQEILPVPQGLKRALLIHLLERGEIENALVFTRTKHRANRLAEFLNDHGVDCERIHGNRSQAQRTRALNGFKSGRYRILVATDVAARGIDIEALSHVINFDVPNLPEDYIHRVGRTARAGMTGEALTFVAPLERNELNAIERAVGKRLPKRTVDGFDYQAKPTDRLEIPRGQRIAALRARRAEERARARAKAQRKAKNQSSRTVKSRPAAGKASASRPAAAVGPHAPKRRSSDGSHRPAPAAPKRRRRRRRGRPNR